MVDGVLHAINAERDAAAQPESKEEHEKACEPGHRAWLMSNPRGHLVVAIGTLGVGRHVSKVLDNRGHCVSGL